MDSARAPHVPVARLSERSPVFAPPDRLVVADASRRVACHACGELLTHIFPAHLTRHGRDGAVYCRRFGLPRRPSLAAPGRRSRRAEEGQERYARNRAGARRPPARQAAHRPTRRTAARKAYLRRRYVAQGWTVHAIGAELRTGCRVPPRLVDAAGVPSSPTGRRPAAPTDRHDQTGGSR